MNENLADWYKYTLEGGEKITRLNDRPLSILILDPTSSLTKQSFQEKGL